MQQTHEWGQHKCRIGRVLTKAGARPRVIKAGWGCLSDHSRVGVGCQTEEGFRRILPQTD